MFGAGVFATLAAVSFVGGYGAAACGMSAFLCFDVSHKLSNLCLECKGKNVNMASKVRTSRRLPAIGFEMLEVGMRSSNGGS